VKYHTPVLLQKVLEFLDPRPGKTFIDATVGGGGHTLEILKRDAKVLGIDRDPEAIKHLKKEVHSSQFTACLPARQVHSLELVQGNFANIGEIAMSKSFTNVDGILFDLGVSSHQLKTADRGFSFEKSGPLDMRMDPNLTVRAYDLVNNFDQRRLNEIFKTYGQEELSWPITGAICRARQIKPIESTVELAAIIKEVYWRKRKKSKLHPATKVFQALRIVVNSELLNLEETLPQTTDLLKIGGRLAIISFHSLEDGIVKRFFKQQERLRVLTPKPIGPTYLEIEKNPCARSAKLRVAEKI